MTSLREVLQAPPDWLERPDGGRVVWLCLILVLGTGLYGASVGWWRSPRMACYVALKMPLLVAATLVFNALLNGLLGMLLGGGLGFRQSWLALLSASAVAALLLGALSPVTLLLAWNAPSADAAGARDAHAAYLLCHTAIIAYAGLVANVHLFRLIERHANGRSAAVATLLAWLCGNAFLGAQFSWILRPFFGSPGLEEAFLREDPLSGNFYETVWRALDRLAGGLALPALILLLLPLAIPLWRVLRPVSQTNRNPHEPNA